MFTRIFIIIVLSLLFISSSFAHDSDRIDQLEKRISILESMVLEKQQKGKIIGTSEGWKSVTNWRKLRTGMSENDVRRILGEPQKIDGGDLAFWFYPNDGRVIFIQGGVDGWSEPR